MERWVKTTALVSLLVSIYSVRAFAGSIPEPPPATAHEPQFGSRELWPEWVVKTDFYKETWPKARILMWFETDWRKSRNLDPQDPKSWLENGKTATEPPDKNTDIVFPTSATRYYVAGREPFYARHVTLEPGAHVRFRDADVHGSLWVKKGGSFSRAKGIFGGTEKNTFCRSDNDEIQFIPNMIIHNKLKGKSTEWIGKWKTGDEVNLFSGRLIVAPDSTFLPTDRRIQRVGRDAELVLLSGSTFHLRGNHYIDVDLLIQGKLLAGTPERPLTKDCTLGLSFKARGRGNVRRSDPADTGLILCPQGEIAVHSASPKTARLVFRWHRRKAESKSFSDGEPPAVAAMPHGINMLLAGTARFNGVEFNDVLKGGIRMPDLPLRTRWRNVFFGAKNFSQPDELFTRSNLTPEEKRRSGSVGRGRQNSAQPHERETNDF